MESMYPRIRQALGLAGGALAVFHGWLFAAQAWSGQLDDPWLILRWIVAASLVGALVALRRNGDSLWGRKGVAVWLLAALLHGPALSSEIGARSVVIPEGVATSVLQLLSQTALAVILLTLSRRLLARHHAPLRFVLLSAAATAGQRLAAFATLHFSPRPPPARG